MREVQGGIDSVNMRIKSIDEKLQEGQEEVKKAFHRPIITRWHFYVHLWYPKMESKLRNLICQLQALAEHFVKIARIVRMLRPHMEEQKPRRGRWFSITMDKKAEKKVWTKYQDKKFEDLKTTLFSILHGGHMLTRNTVLKVYNPYNVSNPIHIDTSKTVIVANFGTEHAEHILVLRGDADDEHFLKVAEQCIGKGAHPPPSNVIHRYPLQTIRPFSLSGGDETC